MTWKGERRSTGWLNVTPDTGNSPVSPNTPQYLIDGDTLEFRGKIEKTTGSWAANASILLVSGANIEWPASFHPPFRRDFVVSGNSVATTANLLFGTDGSITLRTGATVPTNVSLDQLRIHR